MNDTGYARTGYAQDNVLYVFTKEGNLSKTFTIRKGSSVWIKRKNPKPYHSVLKKVV